MKKDTGIKAIVGLAIAAVVVIGASIAISTMNKDNQGSEGQTNAPVQLSLTGASDKIASATQNEDGTYTVVVNETGYIGAMSLEITYSSDGKTVTGYKVLESQETEDIGTKVNEDAYKTLLAGTTLPIYASGMDISAVLGVESNDGTVATDLQDGTYEVVSEPASNGYVSHVTVTVADGKITSVVWDEENNGEWKSVLSTTGKYVMKPVWKTQAESMCAYVVENQGTAGLNLSEAGKTDVVSGVSISVNGFAGLIDQAIAKANGQDGTYEVTGETASNGYTPHVSITVVNGKITAATWDEENNGEWKSVLSEEGKYVMKPVWQTQAESMCAYVVENQGTAGLNLNESGKTDVVSGVSISVNNFVTLVNSALQQASATGEVPEVQEPTIDATKVEVVSGATFSSRAVIRAINEGYVFLRDNIVK